MSKTRSPRLHELAIQPVHGRTMLPVAVIDAQRPDDSSYAFGGHRTWRSSAASAQPAGARLDRGKCKGSSAGGGSFSSGMRPIPSRAKKVPSRGEAVATANGTARMSPAAPSSANPISPGALAATTASMVQPDQRLRPEFCKGEAPGHRMAFAQLAGPADCRAETQADASERSCGRTHMIGVSRIDEHGLAQNVQDEMPRRRR